MRLSLTHSLSPPSLWICLTLVLSLWAISYSVWWPADSKSVNRWSLVCLHVVSLWLKVRNTDDWWREWLQYICHLCSFLSDFFFFLLPVLVFLALLLNPSLSVGTSRKGKGWFKWQEFLSCPSDRRTQTHTASVYTHKHTRSEGCIQHVHIAASERASLYVFLCEQDSLPSVCSSTVHRKPSDYIRH